MLAAGATLGLLAGLVTLVGLERALTIWNDQMALLPWGRSRILGITVHLGIPTSLPSVLAMAGLAVALVGAALALRPARRSPAPQSAAVLEGSSVGSAVGTFRDCAHSWAASVGSSLDIAHS
jgi:hypothetical protein